MKTQNAQGRIYFYGSVASWATVKTVIVKTWGADPPSYDKCWVGLLPGI